MKGEEGQLPPEGGSGAKEDSSTLSDKLACLDAIAQAFTPEHIVEALKDLDELREKLLTKGMYHGITNTNVLVGLQKGVFKKCRIKLITLLLPLSMLLPYFRYLRYYQYLNKTL